MLSLTVKTETGQVKILCQTHARALTIPYKLAGWSKETCEECNSMTNSLTENTTVECQTCHEEIPRDRLHKHYHEITKISSFKVACYIDESGNLVIP